MTAPRFRMARLAEIGTMLDWAAAEGWNPGLEDAAAFQAADPDGFFVAEVADEPVAAISVVNHSDKVAFLGLYICRPEHRGRSIGYRLWTHALAHAGERTVGLDGVADQQANYARSGFERVGASVRFEGRLDPGTVPGIRIAAPGDAAALARLDMTANGYARPAFLAAWTAPAGTRRTLVLDPGEVSGFATIRRCRDGVKIGPVIAPDADAALALARAALALLPAGKVVIDVPSDNRELIERLTSLGFAETFATARMYRGPAPVAGPGLQAIGSMELG